MSYLVISKYTSLKAQFLLSYLYIYEYMHACVLYKQTEKRLKDESKSFIPILEDLNQTQNHRKSIFLPFHTKSWKFNVVL